MRGWRLPILLGIGLGLFGVASGAPPPAPPGGTVTDAGQISSTARGDVCAGQIGAPAKGPASAPRQLNGAGRTAAAPPPLSVPSQGRNTAVTVVNGHDRCDPGTAASQSPECQRIVDKRADELAPPRAKSSPTIADTESDSASLVNSILSGETGTVVALPPAKGDASSGQGDTPP